MSSKIKGHADGSALGTQQQQQQPQRNDPTTAAAGRSTAASVVEEAPGREKTQQQSVDKTNEKKKSGRGSIRTVDPSSGRQGGSEEEAAVGSIHHILKTAFKDLYEEASPGDTELQSATLVVNGSPSGGGGGSSNAMPETSIAGSVEDASAAGSSGPGAEIPQESFIGQATEKAAAAGDAQADTESLGTSAGASNSTAGEEAVEVVGMEKENDEANELSDVGHSSLEDETTIKERNGAIEATLHAQRELAMGLRNYASGKQQEARESDRETVRVLKKKGILLGAHIPMGPSGLALERSQMDEFQGFATSLLDASELARANRDASLRASGNLPWNRFAKDMEEASIITRHEPPGHLKQTSIHNTRESLALKRSTGRRGDLRQLAQQTTAVTDSDESDETVTLGGGGSGGERPSRSRRALENDTTDDESDEVPKKARRVIIKGAQQDDDAEVMTRMHRKLKFRRNPRWDAESRWHEKLLTAVAPSSEPRSGEEAHGSAHRSARKSSRTKGKSKTELLTSIPPPGRTDGENGFFLSTPSIVEYLDYGIDQTYRAELVLRNISCLKRGFMLLPPASEYFSIAKVVFPSSEEDPESGIVTGSGELAPGIGATVSIDFTPDSLGEYHDILSVVTEAGTFEVPIHAHRRRPCLSLPESGVLDCGGCLLGEAKTLRFAVRNTGGRVRFRLFPLSHFKAKQAHDGEEDTDRTSSNAAGSICSSVDAVSLSTTNGDEVTRTGGDKKTGGIEQHCVGEVHGVPVSPYDADDARETGDDGSIAEGGDGILHGKLEDGPFCVFPRDYCVGEGETVTINAEYLPSRTGVHEARFVMLQDNCEQREVCVRALCEQVAVRISSIDGIPVPMALKTATAAAPPTGKATSPQEMRKEQGGAEKLEAMPAVTELATRLGVAEPATISHLIFEPTLLSSNRRRRFTVRNDTSGNISVSWDISDVPIREPSGPHRKRQGRPTDTTRRKSGVTNRVQGSDASTGTLTKMELHSNNSNSCIESNASHGEAAAGAARGAAGTSAAASDGALSMRGNQTDATIGHDDGKSCTLSSSALSAGGAVGTIMSSATKGPFAIVPGIAVVPANGEVSFEVAYSPTSLGETRFEAVANVQGVPSVSLGYHKPDGILPDDVDSAVPSKPTPGTDERRGGIGASDSRFRLFLRSLDMDGEGLYNRVNIADAVRGLLPILKETTATFGKRHPLPSIQGDVATAVGVVHSHFRTPAPPLTATAIDSLHGIKRVASAWHPNQENDDTLTAVNDSGTAGISEQQRSHDDKIIEVSAMLEEAAKRLDPDETASSEYGYPEDQTITFSDALASIGHQLRSRITHAFGEKSLEELVQLHRTDMAGIQVELRASGEAARLSFRPAVLQAPGEVPYGLPLTMDFDVCNSSSASIEFEFNLQGMTMLLYNDALGPLEVEPQAAAAAAAAAAAVATAASGTCGGGSRAEQDPDTDGSLPSIPPRRQPFDLQISPSRAVIPPGGVVSCKAILTSYYVGSSVVRVPLFAPTAAPSELGEELALGVCYKGIGGSVSIEAAELDLGLIAVGTGMSQEVRIKNIGGVPASFSMVQSGTDAEASAESLLRDSAKKHAQERAVEAFEVNSATGDGADEEGRETYKTLGGGLRQTLAAATEPPNIDMAMAGVLGGATLPPPGSVEAATAAPGIAADASNNTLAGRKASTESMGSADSFSVTRDASWLGFEPAFGDISPGKSAAIKVTCEAGKEPERFRAVVRVLVHSCDGRGVSFGSEYVAVRAEIQEPTVYIDEVNVDVGTAYIGVPLKRRVRMVNLSNLEARFKWDRPGGETGSFDLQVVPSNGVLKGKEVREVELRYTARSAGPVEEVYACHVFGMAQPLGFAIKAKNRGPTLSFGLLEDGDKAPRPIQRPSLPQYLGEEPLPDAVPAPSLEFGTVELRGRKKLRVFVRNLSAIATTFTAKVRKNSCTACPKRLKLANMSYSALQRVVANPRALAAYIDIDENNGKQPHAATTDAAAANSRQKPAAAASQPFSPCLRAVASAPEGAPRGSAPGGSILRSSQRSRGADSVGGRRERLVLGTEHEATEAFFSEGGRARTKALFDQREDCFILKQGLGAAFLVEPAEGKLPPWGVVEVSITVFNDTPGRYSDKLELGFAGAPMAYLPIKVVVVGTPLSLKREALGLDMSGPEPLLSFGEVFVGGGKTFRVIKVKNEGTLPAMLTWSMQDANIDAKEAAKKVDVSLEVVKNVDTGEWETNFSLSYRPPHSFQSPFLVQPRQAIVDPRSEGAFKVLLPEHTKGEMAARLVADAYWLPASDASSSQDSSVVSLASLESSAPVVDNRFVKAQAASKASFGSQETAVTPSAVGGAVSPLTPISQPPPCGSSAETPTKGAASAFPVGDGGLTVTVKGEGSISSSESCLSIPDAAQFGGVTPAGGTEGISRGGGGGASTGGGKKRKAKPTSLAATMNARVVATSLLSKTINRKHGRTTTGAVTLKAVAWGIEPRLALDKKTHDALRCDDAASGAPPLASSCLGGGGLTGATPEAEQGGEKVAGGEVGKQFLKFETWSTRASACSSPWTAHPTMRRQISLSNPLTVAVTFVLETRGPFAINPSPTKKRLRCTGDKSRGGIVVDKSTLGGQVVSSATNASGNHTEHKWTNEAVARTAGASAGRGVITKGVSASERQGGGGGGGGAAAIAAAGRAAEATGGGTEAGTAAPAYTTPQPSRRRQQHSMAENSPHQNATAGTNAAPRNTGEALRQEGRQPQPRRCSGNDGTARRKRDGRCAAPDARRTEKLLPGQKYQMELVFMPARASAEMAEALQSSFCPGSEDIPKLILRVAGELCITFSTGHSQTVWLRGEVLRPIITVAPATHSFGTIHTQRRGNATLYLGNPTYADAEWTLSHVPAPPPKHRLFTERNALNETNSPTFSLDKSGGRQRRVSGASAQGGGGRGGRGRCGLRGEERSRKPFAAPAATAAGGVPPPCLVESLFVDDPSVFVFSEEVGLVRGVKLPLASSASCLPEDWNRLEEACWPQQPTRVTWGCVVDSSLGGPCFEGRTLQRSQQSSLSRHAHFGKHEQPETSLPAATGVGVVGRAGWGAGGIFWRKEPHGQRQGIGATLSLERFTAQKEETEEGYRAPRPLEVKFVPKRNVLYRSRFRLTVRGGEGAEIVLEGAGTYQEDSTPGMLPRV